MPVLVLQADLCATIEVCQDQVKQSNSVRPWFPAGLLLWVAEWRLRREFRALFGAVGQAIVAEYESCREDWVLQETHSVR